MYATKNIISRLNYIKNGIRNYSKKGHDKILPATSTLSWDTRVPVKLRMEDTNPGNLTPITVQTMVRNTVEKYGTNTAMVSYDAKDKWSYDEYFQDIQKTAKGFLALGLQPSNAVGIMSCNNPQWFLSSMAAIFAGGLSTGIYTTNAPPTVKYIVDHAPIDILVLENPTILEELLKDQPDLKDMVKNFVLIQGQDSRAATWSEMLEEGTKIDNERLEVIEDNTAANQACMLVYTSGTTGPPKGAMISHDNVTWSSKIAMDHYGWDQVRILSYLPLSHVAGCMIDCYMGCHTGSEVHFADKDALKGTLVENLKRVRPTRFYGVPRVFEKIAEKMQEVGRSNTGLKKQIGDWAKKTATQHITDVRNGVKKDENQSLGYKVAKKVVFSKIHEALGLDQARKYPHGLASAAAPLNLDTHKYFESLDMEIVEFYGSTEASGPQTTNLQGLLNRPGSVGKDYLGVYNKILHPDPEGLGEVAVRSRNVFMGYHKSQEKTLESFEDDWFRSGDLGKIDQDGFLWLTGRLKELLITSGGENIAPVPIENNILAELPRVLSTVVVIGDKRKYLTCLLALKCQADPQTGVPSTNLDPDAAQWSSEKSGCTIETISDFKGNSTLIQAVEQALENANASSISNAQKVQNFAILDNDLSIAGGELGPTLKLKRHVIVQKYAKHIDQLYKQD